MKRKKMLVTLLGVAMLLCACGKGDAVTGGDAGNAAGAGNDATEEYADAGEEAAEESSATEGQADLPVKVLSVANQLPEYEDPGYETIVIEDEVFTNDNEFTLTLFDGVAPQYYDLYRSLSDSMDCVMDDDLQSFSDSWTLEEYVTEIGDTCKSANLRNDPYVLYKSPDGNTIVVVAYHTETSSDVEDSVELCFYKQLGWCDYTEWYSDTVSDDQHDAVYREVSLFAEVGDAEELEQMKNICHDYLGVEVEIL